MEFYYSSCLGVNERITTCLRGMLYPQPVLKQKSFWRTTKGAIDIDIDIDTGAIIGGAIGRSVGRKEPKPGSDDGHGTGGGDYGLLTSTEFDRIVAVTTTVTQSGATMEEIPPAITMRAPQTRIMDLLLLTDEVSENEVCDRKTVLIFPTTSRS